MPDARCHRGPHPDDVRLFAPDAIADLRQATADLSLLLSRGYPLKSALGLVGNRFRLTTRQRIAVGRSACSDSQVQGRRTRCVGVTQLAGQRLAIDGYNLLITIEAALSGGVLFVGRDGCVRDLASVHGTYRRVTETAAALHLIADALIHLEVEQTLWFLDKPVSNSGRLSGVIRDVCAVRHLKSDVEVCYNPDRALIEAGHILVSSDSVVLDLCRRWTALTPFVVQSYIPQARVVDLSGGSQMSENG